MSRQELHERVDSLLDTLQMRFEALQARLVAVEAERDAALKRATEARETADNYAGHCNEACKQLEVVEAERDAARAGEARAVEALRRCHEGAARQLAEPRDHDNDQYALTAIATDCEAVLAAQRSALAWLAQQRREAAAEVWSDIRKVSEDVAAGGGLRLRIAKLVVDECIERAAALRAGEVGND